MKNELPGGCHTSDDEAKWQESTSVQRHNRASEKNFADTKQIPVWINNKTIEWLDHDAMDLQDKNAKITLA